MDTLTAVQALYQEYLDEVAKMLREMKPGEGLLGIGRNPGNAPCHDAFAHKLEAELDAAAQRGMTEEEAREVLTFLVEIPQSYEQDPLVYWMFLAVQTQAEKVIPFLTPQDARTLLSRYQKLYPRLSRMPAQKRVVAALKHRASA